MHLCFLDLEKAFDKVPHDRLWDCLRRKNIPETLICAIQSFYKTCRNYVRTSNEKSEEFKTNKGVRQGDILSPYLFILLMDDVIKACKERTNKFLAGYWKMQPVYISELAFADDVALIAKSEKHLQSNLKTWKEELEKRGMTISSSKTKTMIVSREEKKHQITLGEQALEQVGKFKYLGATIDQKGGIKEELVTRRAAAGRLFQAINRGFLSKKEISRKTKMAVYRSTYVPVLTYGCESWAMTTTHKSQLQASEMRYLRKVVQVTRKDKVRNQTVRHGLEVQPLQNRVEQSQLRWFGHVCRMGIERPPKKAWEARKQGSRPPGRPRIQWEDNIRQALRDRGIDWNQARKKTVDRIGWRSLWMTSTPQGRRGMIK
jgi:hypothetical protein